MGVITIIKPDGTTEYTVRPTHAYTGTCSTAAGTAAKTVTISPAIDNFLEAGVRITVYFSNANTANNPTLSINSGTAKAIYKGSSAITKALLSVGYHDFIYDGTNWQYVSSYIDTNTTYTKLSSSNTNTAGSYTVKGAGSNTGYFLRGDGEWKTPSDTTYDNISASNTKTNEHYTVPGAGSNTSYFLRGDGEWQTPTDTTYAQISSSNTNTSVSYLVPGAGDNTNRFLRGDGSWLKPANTTYAQLSSSNTNPLESYVVPGAGSNTGNFLRGDGTWMPKCAVGGSEKASSDTYHKIYYESSVTNNSGLLYIKFKDRDGATLAINTLVNGTIYNFVFRSDTPAYATRFALKDDTTVSAVSFMTSEGSEVWFGGKTMPLIPTNMVLQFKKDSYGLKYVGPSNLYNMLSSTNISETLGHVVKGAGANTGYFLRGDGTWQPVSGGGGTSYDYISASNTSTNTSYVVRGAGEKTDCFLRGDGAWKTPSNTTYAKLSSSNTNTAGSYVVKGAGSNTSYFLRGDGTWQPVSGGGGGGTTYNYISASNTSTNTSYVVRGAGVNTDCFLRGDGAWTWIDVFTGATNTNDGKAGIVPRPRTGEQYCALLGDGGWHTLPISNKIVQEFECDALENDKYSAAINFVTLKMQNAIGTAIDNISRYASTQEILFKFNGRMGTFDGQSDLMIIEILYAFEHIARQFLNDKAMDYHITVNFEFTPNDKYYENDVVIPAVLINYSNKLEIIETLDNDNKKTLGYDESKEALYIRELQNNVLNILTYRLDCHDVSMNPNVSQYSFGSQIYLKQYRMIYHQYNPVVV